MLKDPGSMNAEEYEEHCATGHVPWRSNCSNCVSGMAIEDPHRAKREKGALPELAYDYVYLSPKDEERVRRGKKRPEDLTRLLIGKETPTTGRTLLTLSLGKGVSHSSHGVDYMKEDIRKLGCKRLIFKCDNERSLVKSLKESQMRSSVEIIG